ncbi:isoprenyl synthetase [Planktosalinus lacus]|uniref:Isoprenyl synthetase n=2 Tax=Planktosalinus lacus TaxID=1526573 RepID=A0A8J2V8F8_9FLAO|nr:isoprenyl synthetase [Planktosalinus lacus]
MYCREKSILAKKYHMLSLDDLREHFVTHLLTSINKGEPKNLYEPISYILTLGGKRLRPALTLMTCELFDSSYVKALNAALAVELFHNFSLIHDDIMDNAPLRRGKSTVHEKWDINTGILSGDAMLILAYQLFENYEPETFQNLAKLFSKTAIEVCEGQQYDIDFEDRNNVTIEEYLHMINYKTAVLVGAAMQMGAIVANASGKSQNAIYEFGRNLGMAFQLQDDFLDVFGDPKSFGKQVGGDIISNKKTYLYLIAKNESTPADSKELEHLYSIEPKNPTDKIEAVKRIFIKSGARDKTKTQIKQYTEKAIQLLNEMELNENGKDQLTVFANNLIARDV